jgi:hypothetical protein
VITARAGSGAPTDFHDRVFRALSVLGTTLGARFR